MVTNIQTNWCKSLQDSLHIHICHTNATVAISRNEMYILGCRIDLTIVILETNKLWVCITCKFLNNKLILLIIVRYVKLELEMLVLVTLLLEKLTITAWVECIFRCPIVELESFPMELLLKAHKSISSVVLLYLTKQVQPTIWTGNQDFQLPTVVKSWLLLSV